MQPKSIFVEIHMYGQMKRNKKKKNRMTKKLFPSYLAYNNLF